MRAYALLAAAVSLSACSPQTDFQRQAGTAANVLAAAAETLDAVHAGRLSDAYATAALANLSEAMPPAGQVMTAKGHPSHAGADRLRAELEAAIEILARPCLTAAGCDWQTQRSQLRRAAADLTQASGR